MRRRRAMLAIACVLALAVPTAPRAAGRPTPSGDLVTITVKARLVGWIGRRDGVYLYLEGTTARMIVGVWPALAGERVRARLEWRRAGARWRLLEVSRDRLSRDSRALFLVRDLPDGYVFRIRARVPKGNGHRADRSPWRYFRAV